MSLEWLVESVVEVVAVGQADCLRTGKHRLLSALPPAWRLASAPRGHVLAPGQ